jgi:hypothetical protein
MDHQYLIRPILILALLGAWCTAVNSLPRTVDEALPTGQIIERVKIRANPYESYALYLPAKYSEAASWPLIICFDPGARGALPLQHYREGAEQYGYILAGSNNSRNGPNVPLSEIVNSLWHDLDERFKIDDSRIYTAGLSGGARVALAVASSQNGAIIGVIASGAGFPTQISPGRDIAFSIYETTGTYDFNNPELQQLDRTLASLGKPHHLAVFDGGHEWPPPAVATSAIGWMQLQAIKSGRVAKSDVFIAALLRKELDAANTLYRTGTLAPALLAYSAIVTDFAGIGDVHVAEQRINELRANKAVQSSLKQEKDLETRQRRESEKFTESLAALNQIDERDNSVLRIDAQVADTRKLSQSAAGSADNILGRRLLSLFFVICSEQARDAVVQKRYSAAVDAYSICAKIQPENPGVQFQLARAFLRNGERKRAADALDAAKRKGFSDNQAIENLTKEISEMK